jgi:hypothetical protein
MSVSLWRPPQGRSPSHDRWHDGIGMALFAKRLERIFARAKTLIAGTGRIRGEVCLD